MSHAAPGSQSNIYKHFIGFLASILYIDSQHRDLSEYFSSSTRQPSPSALNPPGSLVL